VPAACHSWVAPHQQVNVTTAPWPESRTAVNWLGKISWTRSHAVQWWVNIIEDLPLRVRMDWCCTSILGAGER
jgi:hypothetical protein